MTEAAPTEAAVTGRPGSPADRSAPTPPSRAAYGLAPRPAPDPAVLAVLAAAVDQVWPRPRVVVAEEDATPPAWRFSGRWWTRPAAARRDRPWC